MNIQEQIEDLLSDLEEAEAELERLLEQDDPDKDDLEWAERRVEDLHEEIRNLRAEAEEV